MRTVWAIAAVGGMAISSAYANDEIGKVEVWTGTYQSDYERVDDKKKTGGMYNKISQTISARLHLDKKTVTDTTIKWEGTATCDVSVDVLGTTDWPKLHDETRGSDARVIETPASLSVSLRRNKYTLHLCKKRYEFDTTHNWSGVTGSGSEIVPTKWNVSGSVQPEGITLPEQGVRLRGQYGLPGLGTDDKQANAMFELLVQAQGKMNVSEKGSVSWSLLPEGMKEPEATLEFARGGDEWVPEDDNQVEAVLSWESDVDPTEVRFTLYDISEEPGLSLNSKDRNTDLDLEFGKENAMRGYKITQSDKTFIAEKKGNFSSGEKISIHAKDFGAYGKLKAEINVDGSWIEATAKPFDLSYLPVPYDKNKNMIADKWEKDVGLYTSNLSPEWDEDPFPAHQKGNGDGFTLYEEYRGFQEIDHEFRKGDHEQVKDGHVRMDPMYKDVFIVDLDGLFMKFYKPYNSADLNWHLIDVSMIKGTGSLIDNADFRWVNFNTSKKHFFRNQYAIFIVSKDKSPDPKFPNAVGDTPRLLSCSKPMRYSRPLKCIYSAEIYMGRVNEWASGAPGTSEDKDKYAFEQATSTVVHELGHAVGIAHHAPNQFEGAKNCAIRYDTGTEMDHPRLFGFLRTHYCNKSDAYITGEADASGNFKQFEGHNCYGQINIKGD